MKQTRLMAAIAGVTSRISNPFRLDLRSLAFYRVAIGFVLLIDIIMRWTDMTVHYTNQGIVSADLARQTYASFSFSLHSVVDAWWWVALLFALQTVFAIALIVGYRTRLAVALSFVLLVSVQNRNTALLNGGDVLLRAQLFWSILLPLNRYFSVDLAQNRVLQAAKKTAFNPATIAIVIQTVLLFWQTSALKTGDAWRETYEALYIALNAEQFNMPWGTWISQFRTPMRMMTWMAIVVETIAPVLIISPFFNRITRSLALVLLLGLYAGIFGLMAVGVFPLIGMATILVLIPGIFWDKISNFIHAKRQLKTLTVYYDQSCGICVKFVQLLSAFGLTRNIMVRNIYDSKQIAKLSNSHNSWVGKVGRKHMFKADVFIEILRRSALWWVLVPIIRFKPIYVIANAIYVFVSTHRTSVCKPVSPVKTWQRVLRDTDRVLVFFGQAAVLILIMSCVVWVRADMAGPNALEVSGRLRSTVRFLRLDQHWNMFAPTPVNYNAWPVVEGAAANGDTYDVWRPYWDDGSAAVDFSKPDHANHRFVNPRWRRVLTRLSKDNYAQHRTQFLRYMCSEWNTQNPSQPITSIRYYEMKERTLLTGEPEAVAKNLHADLDCSN